MSSEPREPAPERDDGAATPAITEPEARAIAAEEAAVAYRDLSVYTVSATLDAGRWLIDYELADETLLGGGPHFAIDAATGEIVARRYEQ